MIVCGFNFHGNNDMTSHFRALIADPWIRGCPLVLDKAERRALRCTAPTMPVGYVIYNADGASRSRDEGRLASCGVVININRNLIARLGIYLGNMTNNESEYSGALAALRHIESIHVRQVILHLDSFFVVRQINGQWACKATHLQDIYENALELIREIRQSPATEDFRIEHVYREYNADADATANETIDMFVSSGNGARVQISEF